MKNRKTLILSAVSLLFVLLTLVQGPRSAFAEAKDRWAIKGRVPFMSITSTLVSTKTATLVASSDTERLDWALVNTSTYPTSEIWVATASALAVSGGNNAYKLTCATCSLAGPFRATNVLGNFDGTAYYGTLYAIAGSSTGAGNADFTGKVQLIESRENLTRVSP